MFLDTLKGYTDLGLDTLSSVINMQKSYEEGKVEVAGKASSLAASPSFLAGISSTTLLLVAAGYLLLRRRR